MGRSIEEQRELIRTERKSIEEKVRKKRSEKRENRMQQIMRVSDFLVRGVYFLYKGDKIVYIGKSDSNVMNRICDHLSEGVKKFDSFRFEKKDNLGDKDLDRLERSLIRQYNPRYNIVHKRKRKRPRIIYGMNTCK